MNRYAISALCLCLLTGVARAQSTETPVAQEAPAGVEAAAAEPVPEQIHVVAQRPGPGMWKVSKDEHVLWVFGAYGPVPKDMVWRSQQVERVIAGSQEFLSPPVASARPGLFKYVTLLPRLIGVRKNPDGARLRDVLPAEDYARWSALKAKYLPGNDDVERERPIFAAQVLTEGARRQAGLYDGKRVREQVLDLVERNKLKVTSATFEIPMDNAGKVLSNFKKSSANDAACLVRTMATLEEDIADASARAEAWSRGDMDALRRLDFTTRREACFGALMNSVAFDAEPEFRNAKARAHEKWIAQAERALAANASTFAMLQIEDILDPQGVIATLAARGYMVEQPE